MLYAYIDVEPVGFNRGYFTVDVRYFYRVTADAFVGAARELAQGDVHPPALAAHVQLTGEAPPPPDNCQDKNCCL